MRDLKSSVHYISGIFFSLSIVTSVLALAQWNFYTHSALENSLYAGALILGFKINTVISVLLYRGILIQKSSYLKPYIICSGIHLFISVFLVFYFCFTSIYGYINAIPNLDFIGIPIFLCSSAFWLWSLRIVRDYRDLLTKLSGEHHIFVNPSYI